MEQRLPKLPALMQRKIYKTGQTRGADDDVIFQNRVNRNGTVLIPYPLYDLCLRRTPQEAYEHGFIVLVKPEHYFETPNFAKILEDKGLRLGENTLLFYETREQWNRLNPQHQNWQPATNRIAPLGGEYVARVPATTSQKSGKINQGFTSTGKKGAGIRVYEYAHRDTIQKTMLQLEWFYWQCYDAQAVSIAQGMKSDDALKRATIIQQRCEQAQLADRTELQAARILNRHGQTICPLCLEPLSATGFYNRMEQAEGRDVPDLTITQLNLFHINELRIGQFNHKPYNLGWGHHHCNVVTKDMGIFDTLSWMAQVVDKNELEGYTIRKKG
jgi:hypothetical protein